MDGRIIKKVVSMSMVFVLVAAFFSGGAVLAEEGETLPGYENTVWGETAPDGQVISGLRPDSPELQFAENRDIRVLFNGGALVFPDQPPVIEGGRVMVPLRPVLESIYVQCRVSWDAEKGEVIIRDQRQRQVIIVPGEYQYTVVDKDGAVRKYPLDVPAIILNGRVLLPLRALLERFDYRVTWLSRTRAVDIQDTYPAWRTLMPPEEWRRSLGVDTEDADARGTDPGGADSAGAFSMAILSENISKTDADTVGVNPSDGKESCLPCQLKSGQGEQS